jgi:hypothetical protein
VFKKIAVWGYNSSFANIIKPNVSDDVKVAYSVGAWIGSLWGIFVLSYVLINLED